MTPRTTTWDPAQYGQFAAERSRPFTDLVSEIDLPGALEIADLGCGTGALTAELAERWPAAHVVGIDTSPEMLGKAGAYAIPSRLEFHLGDVRTWEPPEPLDIIVSNATLHWVAGHLGMLERFASFLAPGGMIAFQVPGNFNEPTHQLLAALAASARWRETLSNLGQPPSSHDPAEYLEALFAFGLMPRAWETTYCQVLQGDDAVLEWMKGTALRPFLSALTPDEQGAFLAEYGAELRDAYPAGPAGTLLPFRRVFAIGQRPGNAQPTAVANLDHVQVAMPEGREDEARGFYGELLGFVEVQKPPVLAARGGCWFKSHAAEVHLGVDRDFRPATKAHVGLAISDLDALAERVAAAGHRVIWDDELTPRRRFYTDDPFGNRIELLSRL